MAGPDQPILGMTGAAPGPKRVTRTGIALVHENELVFPAAGSEIEAIQAIDDSRTTAQVFIPVHIEIRDAQAGFSGGVEAGDQEGVLYLAADALDTD